MTFQPIEEVEIGQRWRERDTGDRFTVRRTFRDNPINPSFLIEYEPPAPGWHSRGHSTVTLGFFKAYCELTSVIEPEVKRMSPREATARNRAFKASRGVTVRDGQIWDEAWAAARRYYAPNADEADALLARLGLREQPTFDPALERATVDRGEERE